VSSKLRSSKTIHTGLTVAILYRFSDIFMGAHAVYSPGNEEWLLLQLLLLLLLLALALLLTTTSLSLKRINRRDEMRKKTLRMPQSKTQSTRNQRARLGAACMVSLFLSATLTSYLYRECDETHNLARKP
jgi:heme A synthase